ncbi:hypothetical protein JXJ21_07150 [candidate division KSB1 bacterium]|nr:hypothetical protein [candidate division KSB1 bacterium]
MNKSILFKLATSFWILTGLLYVNCHIKPADPGEAVGNALPETFMPNVPPEESMNNSYKLKLEWHGNDSDGVIAAYEYRIDGELFDNTWQRTRYHYEHFKFRNGWYTIEIRSVDNKGGIDPTPVKRKFHVKGPTFSRGILLIDNDIQTVDTQDQFKDALIDSILMGAGFLNYTVWDYDQMFGIWEKPVFVDSSVDVNGNTYYGLSAYSTIIWTVGTGSDQTDAQNSLSKIEATLMDYLDMGGNLWISGVRPMLALLGSHPSGTRLAPASLSRKYLHIQSADTLSCEHDIFLGVEPGYDDIPTKYVFERTGQTDYLGYIRESFFSTNQIIPEPDADPLFVFSDNVYPFEQVGVTHQINLAKYAHTPCAIRYRGENYVAITFGFPLVQVTMRGGRKNKLDQEALRQCARQILVNEFGETPDF